MGLEPRPPQGPEQGLGTSLQPRRPGHTCSPTLCLQNQLSVQLLSGTFGVETARGYSGA